MHAKLLQSCPTLCDPINCSPPGSSVYGILQAGLWSGLPFPSSWDLPDPEIEPVSLTPSALAGRLFITNATWEIYIYIYTHIYIYIYIHIYLSPVVMYGCESWTVKKAEHQRMDAFELWCWRRLLRVPRSARRSNQSILNEISPEYSLEGLMLKPKLQSFGHLMGRADSFEKALMLGKIEVGGEEDDRG